jgi:hypothetical protein
MRLVTINNVEYIFLLQTLTKVFISRILINFYNINHINFCSAKHSSEAVASLPQWKLRHCKCIYSHDNDSVFLLNFFLKYVNLLNDKLYLNQYRYCPLIDFNIELRIFYNHIKSSRP